MPKVYIAFSLPTETEEFEIAMAGHEYKYCLDDLDRYLRDTIKYHSDNANRVRLDAFNDIRTKLTEIMNHRGLI